MWAMEGTSVELTLSKQDGMHWWNCVVKGDPVIDTQKVIGYDVLYATSFKTQHGCQHFQCMRLPNTRVCCS